MKGISAHAAQAIAVKTKACRSELHGQPYKKTASKPVHAESARLRKRDSYTRELDEAVREARRNERWRLEYMTLQMHYQEKYEQGLEKGLEKGRNLGLEQSALRMIEAGRLALEEIALYSRLTVEQVAELEREFGTRGAKGDV